MNLKQILPQNGPPIEEVSKYIEKYKDEIIVIKYGRFSKWKKNDSYIHHNGRSWD